MPIDVARADVTAMQPFWTKCRDVIAGEAAVKAKGEEYLPKIDGGQLPDDYTCYRRRASFYNGTARTREALIGMAFHRDPEFKLPEGNVKTTVDMQLQDITLSGVPAPDFASSVLNEVISVGRAGILVDMQTLEAAAKLQTVARPYFVLYKAEDIINWRTARVGGDEVTTLVILHESVEEEDPADPYTPLCVEQWRVLQLDAGVYSVTVYRKRKGDDAKEELYVSSGPVVPTRRGKPLQSIPFVPINSLSATWDVVKPPMLDLVYVNLSHYMVNADYEWGCHMTGLPTPWGVGFPSDAKGKPVPLGPGAVWMLEGPNAQAGMLEFRGEGLGALEKNMDRKEEQMAVLGSRILESAPKEAETAEAVRSRGAAAHAGLRTMVNAVSLALTRALRILVWWNGFVVPDADVEAAINREFFENTLTSDDVKAELLRWQAGGSSFETFFYNMGQGRRNRPGVTVDEEKKLIDAEGVVALQAQVTEAKAMAKAVPPAKPAVGGKK